MELLINGKKENIDDNLTIAAFLKAKDIRPEVVTIEVNEKIVERDKYQEMKLQSNDKMEYVFYMGGGAMDPKIANDVNELIGNTPLVRLNQVVGDDSAEVLAKIEFLNPGGSVKDRICLAMIKDAEEKGLLKANGTIVEPTSGNTGIGLAMISAVKGYKCILTMPDTMSLERIYILKSFGAKVVLTPGIEGMQGAIDRAEKISKETPGSFMPQQFNNKANPEVHRQTTAQEIIRATDGKVDAFVAGVGTGGTITGVGEVLKKENPNVKIYAVEPEGSPILSGGKPGPHKIQGIGAGFIPEVLNQKIIDEIIKVNDNVAFRTSRDLAKKEGLFVGISAGAATWAALEVAKKLGKGKRVVVIIPDTGERYFSMERYFEA